MNVEPFEHLAAKIIAAIAEQVPKQFTSLFFTLPLCFRTPDICIL